MRAGTLQAPRLTCVVPARLGWSRLWREGTVGRGRELATETPLHLHCRTGGEEAGKEVGLPCRVGVGSGLREGVTLSCLTPPTRPEVCPWALSSGGVPGGVQGDAQESSPGREARRPVGAEAEPGLGGRAGVGGA